MASSQKESGPSQGRLDSEGASFALDYLRTLSTGSIPNCLRTRIGESDLVQDALVKAVRSFEQFRGTSVDCFRAWLRQIFQCRLKNLVRDHVLCKKRSVRREIDNQLQASILPILVDTTPVSPTETDDSDLQIMQRCFEQLPQGDQEIIQLHSRIGFTFVKIAEMLELSEDAVRKRYSRAIHRWRVIVEKTSSEIE